MDGAVRFRVGVILLILLASCSEQQKQTQAPPDREEVVTSTPDVSADSTVAGEEPDNQPDTSGQGNTEAPSKVGEHVIRTMTSPKVAAPATGVGLGLGGFGDDDEPTFKKTKKVPAEPRDAKSVNKSIDDLHEASPKTQKKLMSTPVASVSGSGNVKPLVTTPDSLILNSLSISSAGVTIVSDSKKNQETAGNLADEILARMSKASIAFNTPETIEISEPAQIQLLLSFAKAEAALSKEISQPRTVVTAQISASEHMKAVLTGTGFTITPLTEEEQLAPRTQETEWLWTVVPNTGGQLTLQLSLSAIVDINGNTAKRTIKVFAKNIEVDVPYSYVFTEFVGDNWQWLWSAILVPIAGWYYMKRKKSNA